MDCQKHTLKIRDGLRSKKIKVTPARLRLLDIFEHARGPLDASQVLGALGQLKTNQSTVYRNLESLVKLGLLKRLNLRSRQAYYELADDFSDKKHHHHLVCTGCAKIVEVIDCRVESPSASTLRKCGFKILSDHVLEFSGLCLGCYRKSLLKKAVSKNK